MRPDVVVCSTVLGVLILMASPVLSTANHEDTGGSITILYNHEGPGDLVKRGGFSAFVRFGDKTVLFDVGGEASVILENVQRAGVSLVELDAVMISHNHWDHVYGLPGVMSGSRTRAPVFVPASAADGIRQQFPRATVVAVAEPKEILPAIWTTGPLDVDFMGASLSEQALVFEHSDGLHVIAGCSHPGIVAIVERVREMFPGTPIALVAGGFHLRSTGEEEIRKIASDLKRLGVKKIGPSHCSGDDTVRIFREQWGKDLVTFGLGEIYQF